MQALASGRFAFLIALTCLTVAACHHTTVGSAAAESGNGGAVTLRIVNHSWLDVNVYLQQGTRRDRIGTATATSTTEFHVPLRRIEAGEYRLFGDPVGSRETVRSEPLHAQEGDVVTWTLEDDLKRSFIDVR